MGMHNLKTTKKRRSFMKTMQKRIISLFLAVMMIVSIIPMGTISASAAGGVKAKLDSFISKYPSGSRWTGTFDGGSQCYGFGKMVIYNIFGKNSSGGYRGWNYAGVSTSGMNVIGSITSFSSSNVQSLLSKAKCGDVLQFDQTKQHTMIVYSVDSTGVTVYDCNWDNNCGISKRHSSFGAWAGRNSSKLTLLRSNNYESIDGPAVSHKVDTKYDKNFTAYPKAKITASNIFDANHNQISSTAWIGTSDKCTINEVYTDGCCKITYPLDGGGTKTAYSKISLFKPSQLTVNYNANGGTVTSDTYKLTNKLIYEISTNKKYGQVWEYNSKKTNGLVNAKTFGLARTGYTFKGWGTSASGGTIFDQDDTSLVPTKINSAIKNGNCSTTLYAIWTPNNLTVNYNANGGTVTSDTYKLTNSLVYVKSTNEKLGQVWQYNSPLTNGLFNAKTFGLTRTGYTFKGWGTSASGGTIFDQDDESLVPTKINSAIKNGSCSTTLYAAWKANTYTVKYNANGGIGTMPNSSHTYDTAKALTANGFTRTGYTFLGWSTNASATSATYTDKQSVKNLTATNGGTVTLYAVWQKSPATVSSISIQSKPTKTVYTVGETFNSSGLSVKVNMSDGSTKTLTSGFAISTPDMITAGTKTVTVTYEGKTATFNITANAPVSPTVAQYKISGATATAGSTVEVYVSIENNPGIISLRNKITYDTSVMELVKVEDMKLLAGYTTPSPTVSSPYTLRWADSLATENNKANGNFVKLTFKIKDSAEVGDYGISVTHIESRTAIGEKVEFADCSAVIKVIDYLLGDVDGNGEIDDWDAILLNRYLAGWQTEIIEAAAEIDGDGELTDWDAIALERRLAGWDV